MSKTQYMCILRSESSGCEQPQSASDMEAMYAKYQAWQEKFADNIVDMGAKLGDTSAVVRHDKVIDGPFIELKEVVGGYMKISASDIEEAKKVITESPMVSNPGVSIEIREIQSR